MKKNNNTHKISEVLSLFETNVWKNDLAFQRKDDAWKKKTKKMLIKSVLENYYIPPILLTNKNILDGLQRLTALKEFKNNQYKIEWNSKNNKNAEVSFNELSDDDKQKFLSYELFVCDVKNDDGTELDQSTQEEFFIRINENSIKLSKDEKLMAIANDNKRRMIRDIAELDELQKLANKKNKDKRFSHSFLIARCLTIIKKIENDSFGTKYIRKSIEPWLKEPMTNQTEKSANMCKKIIKSMYSIFGDDGIPPKYFNVMFESIFTVFYLHFDSLNSYESNSAKIKKIINNNVKNKLIENQMGGGSKYDSFSFVKTRIEMVNKALEEFNVDAKRQFSQDERYQIWWNEKNKSKNGKVYCSKCGVEIKSWHDFNADHILAHTKGGKTTFENCQILCEHCNKSKGSK